MARIAVRIVPVRRGRPGQVTAHIHQPGRGWPRGRWAADWVGVALGVGRAIAAARRGHDGWVAARSWRGSWSGRYGGQAGTLDAG